MAEVRAEAGDALFSDVRVDTILFGTGDPADAVERARLIDPNAGSRLIGSNTAYYAIGTGGGAIAATIAYSASGWSAVCILGAGLSTLDS